MFETEDSKVVLAASDVTDRLACAHLLGQRLAIARGERGRPRPADDPYAELIRMRGIEHERVQLGRLESELGPCVDLETNRPPRTRSELLAAAADAREAMQGGAPLIYQATFFDGIWQGRTDFLRRVEVPSSLGPFSYEVLDTKLARRVKPVSVHQLVLYSRLLSAVQGRMPERAHVILGDGGIEAIELARFAALGRRVAKQVEAIVAEPTPTTYPEPVAHCDICALAFECGERQRADDHLSLVARATRLRRERLLDIGITTLHGLAESSASIDPLRLGEDALDLLRNQAALQVSSTRIGEPTHRHLSPARARGYAALPEASGGDVFFDLEGDPFLGDDGIEYLWGWWTHEHGYECRWAHDPAAEKAALEDFVDRLGKIRASHPRMRIYHYAPHERSKLRSLSVKYATREAEVDELLRLGVLVDLFEIVRHALQVGEESYSLKSLERHHGFVRSENEVREGGGSIVMYERWLEAREEEMLESIRAYNEEDCRSTASLRKWLAEVMRPEAERELGVEFATYAKPAPEEDRTPPDWLADVEALAARLLDGLPADDSADSRDQARRRLMAHLILYHHRESKPEWWRHFDLRSMSVDDLIWERDAIAEIQRDETTAPVEVDSSRQYAYTFPAQEFKLSPGRVKDPTSDDGFNLVELEPGRLVLKRRKADPPPAPVALVGNDPIGSGVLREALVEVAERLEDPGPDDSAVIRLLDRAPPELPAELLGEDIETLIDACLDLGSSVLPIQGPPGTGKTYRAARMIVGALASGLRVGMTAQSHAAIQNLLAEVEKVARDWPLNFAGVYRGAGYASLAGAVKSKKNARVTEDHQLVAGTAWLFASPDLREKLDLLFVDEAGQFSLANAAAAGTAARGIVLLGDPQQLPQVTQADHPFGSGASALEHLLAGANTVDAGRGVLLTETWRMHPDVCRWVSERSYDGLLRSKPDCANRRVDSAGAIQGSGLRLLAVEHHGRSQYSPEEAKAIGAACRDLLADGTFMDVDEIKRSLEPGDLMIVAPYNMAVNAIAAEVPDGVRVGTVDRFQGKEAPVVFYAMTCSAGEDVPRGLGFLLDQNRMNVAVSRAQCLAVLVHSPRLLEADCPTLEAMEALDGVCRFAEVATEVN